MFRKLGSISALMSILVFTIPAYSWNDTGHMLVALVAYHRLDPATRTKIVQMLEKHPRFNDDFIRHMPPSIKEGADREKWIFVRAATWPDFARGFKGQDRTKYHHATWHYINEPLFLNPDDEAALGNRLKVNLSADWSESLKPGDMNVMQALAKARADITSPGINPAEKALSLCWIAHLVGDLHQPLHSSAVFSEGRFPEGDRGGNSIPIGEPKAKSLHQVWDGLLGQGKSVTVLSHQAEKLLAEPDLQALGDQAAASLEFKAWMDESVQAAREFAYDDDVLTSIARGEDNPDRSLESIDLSPEYMDSAKLVAKQRVVQAGCRLAELLKAAGQ